MPSEFAEDVYPYYWKASPLSKTEAMEKALKDLQESKRKLDASAMEGDQVVTVAMLRRLNDRVNAHGSRLSEAEESALQATKNATTALEKATKTLEHVRRQEDRIYATEASLLDKTDLDTRREDYRIHSRRIDHLYYHKWCLYGFAGAGLFLGFVNLIQHFN